MAKRTTANFVGDVGEARALMELLQTGASINSLTQSDSGWDLHLHLPTTPQFVRATDPKRTWTLSGRVAHVQVKKQTGRSKPRVALGTARGWLTGTRSGVPTFLVVVKGKGLFYASPVGIDNWLFHRRDCPDESEYSTGGLRGTNFRETQMRLHRLEPSTFGKVLHAWSAYPNVMARLDDLDTARNEQRAVPLETAAGWVAQVAAGFLSATHSPNGEVDSWWMRSGVSRLASRAQTALDWDDRNDAERFEQAVQHAIAGHQFGDGWVDGLPVGTYCGQTDPDEMLAAGCELLSTILSGLPAPI